MGEGIIEATITRWFVQEGDYINRDESIVEVATDKVDSEVPSPVSGKIIRIIYHEGEIPKIGEVLAIIQTNAQIDDSETNENEVKSLQPETVGISENKQDNQIVIESINKEEKTQYSNTEKKVNNEIYLTPLVRFLARSRGIPVAELKMIQGTGSGGRITKDDLNNYINSGRRYQKIPNDNLIDDSGTVTLLQSSSDTSDYKLGEGEEIIEMDRTRRLIAEHMIRSKHTSPHVTSMAEVDVTQLVQWREKNKEQFLKKYGIKLTYTPVIVEASLKALKEYPNINISVVRNNIIKKHYFNIGIATALPNGNLIVPVIKDANKSNFVSIALQLADLASRARKGQLLPAEIKGGTFTITNMGQYDNISGTPIINQPEVAILAVGAIKKKPAVVNIGNELSIGIRDILILSLTYDHRVIDGALGGSFVRKIGEYLEKEIPII